MGRVFAVEIQIVTDSGSGTTIPETPSQARLPEEKEDTGGSEATLLGVRRAALVEMAAFCTFAIVVDRFFLDGTRFWETYPHPFWILVVLISAQYGTTEGLLACVVASALLLVGNLPEQTLSQDLYDYLLHLLHRPILWFVSAIILGELRLRHLRERNELRREAAASKHREVAIASGYEKLQKVKENLEARVAGQLDSAIKLYETAQALENLEPDAVLRGITDLVRTTLHADKFSLFLIKENQLILSVSEGWTSSGQFASFFPRESPFFRELVSSQKFLCIVNPEEERILANQGVLAGPLVAEQGETLGVLKIEEMGFSKLSLSSVQTFKVLCRWIATSYGNALRYEKMRSNSLLSEDTRLYSSSFFSQQKAFLVDLAERVGFDLSTVVIRLVNSEDLSPQELKEVPELLDETVKTALRRTDLVFESLSGGYEYAVVLAATPTADTGIVLKKLEGGIRNQQLAGKAIEARFSLMTQELYSDKGEGGILPHHQFKGRMDFLQLLRARVSFPMSIAMFRVDVPQDVPYSQTKEASRVLREGMVEYLATNSAALVYQASATEMIAALPAMSLERAQRWAIEIQRRANDRLQDLNLRVRFAVQEAPEEGKDWDSRVA